MKGKLLFLGTGASTGIPLIGCQCSVCKSNSPLNNRLRPSALLKINDKKFLIDAGPDFRAQALRAHLTSLDGVLFTHAHHDHTAGIDDLRVFYFRTKQPLPALLSQETATEVQKRYDYIFKNDPIYEKLITKIKLHILHGREGSVHFEGLPLKYLTYYQGGMAVNGFIFGDLAYLSDIHEYDESIFKHLHGVKKVVISALRHEKSGLHLSLNEAVEFISRTGAQQAWLTHISHDLDHEKTNKMLPDHIRMAYDGLEIEI